MDRMRLIDRLIDDMLMPRKCRVRRGSCECGHIDIVHAETARGLFSGACVGGHGRCRCTRFRPKTYERELKALRRKYRSFAVAVLDACDGLIG